MSSTTANTNSKTRNIFYWIITTIVAIVLALTGIGNVARFPRMAHDIVRLGYPEYILSIVGTWKILGAVAIIIPRAKRLKEWAYAGIVFDTSGAIVSRLIMQEGLSSHVLLLLTILSLAVASAALRPPGRTLASH